MNLVEKAIKASKDIWDECIETPFIKEICNNSLSNDRLVKYIVEDSIYLREYARCFAYAMTRAKTLEEMAVYYSILSFVNESETSERRLVLKRNNIKESDVEEKMPSLENSNYIEHMISIAKNEDNLATLMAILPCMLSYLYIFKGLLEESNYLSNNKFAPLLTAYTTDEYEECCAFWTKYTNSIAMNLTTQEEEHLIDIFKKSSLCELDFWKMSYNID